MFVDDAIAEGIIDPNDVLEFDDHNALKTWLNAVFWSWYSVHSNEEVRTFRLLGFIRKTIRYADLYPLFVWLFGPEPSRADSTV